jgi:hypothetical protein
MSYCQKCGAELDEDAKFCRVCGAPVEAKYTKQETFNHKRHRSPYAVPLAVVIAVVLVGGLVAAAAIAPLRQTDFSQTEIAAAVPDVNTVYVNFEADIADVNVIPTDLPDQLVKLDVSAVGSTGLFGSNSEPVKVTFTNHTQDGILTVTSKVSRTESWISIFNLEVTCDLYVDYSVDLNIDAHTAVGKVSLNSQVPVVFQNLTLKSTTGSVETNISGSAVLTQDISVSTTTGNVDFSWNDVQVSRNISVTLATTTGEVTANVAHFKVLAGNVSISAQTTTGDVNVGVDISGDVGAQLTSHTTTGGITVDATSFNGDSSPVYSSNYPASSNFLVDSQTFTGGIHLKGAYHNQEPEKPFPEQARDAAVSYIKANHPDAAQFINGFDWAGGRQTPEGLDGAETYSYVSQNWNVTIHYPVVPNPSYAVMANYTHGDASIAWEGTWQNGDIAETNYASTLMTSMQEEARNDVMGYIREVHVETAQFINDLNWSGGRVDTGLLGAEKYVYTTLMPIPGGAGWTVALTYPVVPNPVYTVTANYTQTGVLSPYSVLWEGTWQDGAVNETSYSTNVPVTQEQIRDSTMNYIKFSHNETAQFMQDLNWTGGRVDRGLLVGSERYTYLSGGWNVTMTYPVVLNPIYAITADYKAQGIGIPYRVIWEGTWQNGTLTETNYTFAQ